MLTECCVIDLISLKGLDQLVDVSVGELSTVCFTHLFLAIDLGSSVSSVHSDSKLVSVTKFLFTIY